MKNAIILCVGCEDWTTPKTVLMETVEGDERISTLAQRALEKYKEHTGNYKLYLVDYTYYGELEII